MSGWISLHRKIRKNPIFNDMELLRLWLICLTEATHKEREQPIGRQMVHLEAGQFVTGRYDLHEMYNRGLKRDQQKSPKTVWRWLEVLETSEYLKINSTNKFSIVAVLNWHRYQSSDHENDQQMTNKVDENDENMTNNMTNKKQLYCNDSGVFREVPDHENDQQMTNKTQNMTTNNNDNKKPLKPSSPKQVYDEQSIPFRLSNYLLAKIREFKPDIKEPNLQVWADDMRKIVELDKKDPKQVSEVIEWVTQDSFWQSNILSASKLRLKWDTVTAKMMQTKRYRDTEKKVVQVDFTASEEEKRNVAQAYAKQSGLQAANNE